MDDVNFSVEKLAPEGVLTPWSSGAKKAWQLRSYTLLDFCSGVVADFCSSQKGFFPPTSVAPIDFLTSKDQLLPKLENTPAESSPGLPLCVSNTHKQRRL